MTNPINIGLNIASSSPASFAGKSGAPGASDFAILLEGALKAGNESTINVLGSASATSVPPVDAIDLDALSEALGDLLGLLSGIENGIDEEQPLDMEALEALAGLLETVNGMLATGAVIDPDSPLLSQLGDLAQSLGVNAGGDDAGPEAVLESLSALAARVGAQLREPAPELAAALTELARRLDTHIAGIESALANARPDASMQLKLVESETKPNAAAAIAQNAQDRGATTNAGPNRGKAAAAPSEGSLGSANAETGKANGDSELSRAGQRTAQGESGRSLTGSDNQTADKPAPNGTQPGNYQAVAGTAAAAAVAASASPETQADAPDGLTMAPGQTNSANGPHGVTRPEAAAYSRPEPRINVPHVAVEIARSIQNGLSRFEIRLNPPELGRIDVRLEMDTSGNVTARLAVEKSETLDLLQRDQRALEKALGDAGIDTGKTDLEFSLRQDNEGNDYPQDRDVWKASIADGTETPAEITNLSLTDGAMRGYARLDAVNLWV